MLKGLSLTWGATLFMHQAQAINIQQKYDLVAIGSPARTSETEFANCPCCPPPPPLSAALPSIGDTKQLSHVWGKKWSSWNLTNQTGGYGPGMRLTYSCLGVEQYVMCEGCICVWVCEIFTSIIPRHNLLTRKMVWLNFCDNECSKHLLQTYSRKV